ncbi:MAG: CAP domain-containing protein [Gaiellaceae bacterium]
MKRVFRIIGVLAAVATVLLAAGRPLRRERAVAGAAGARGVAAGNCTPGRAWGISRPGLAAEVVSLVNAHRRALGLESLRIVRTLSRAARWKALHMAHYLYMSHDDPAPPVARSAAGRIAACGFRGARWGENIAYGYPTPQAVVQGWLSSPGHRANIENPGYRMTGVGVTSRSVRLVFWTQDFGG